MPSEQDRQAAHRIVETIGANAPAYARRMIADAIAQARADGRRQGIEEAAQYCDARVIPNDRKKPVAWYDGADFFGALLAEELRALLDSESPPADAGKPCAHFRAEKGRCAYGAGYTPCEQRCCVGKD